MRNVIVTGADGFLGRHLVSRLRLHAVHVTALSRWQRSGAPSIAMGDAPWCPTRLAGIFDDIRPDTIFHLVGGAVGCGAELEQLNLGVTTTIMRAIQDVGIRPLLVCCGSAAEYGRAVVDGTPVRETVTCDPMTAYGQVKLAQTRAALAFAESTGTPVLIARIFNPIGPGMPPYLALADFARQIARLQAPQGVLETGNIHVRRDFADVEHVAAALVSLARNPNARGIVNVCSGKATELSELVRKLIEISGKNVAVETAASRLRAGEPDEVVGSTVRLVELGAMPPPTDVADVVARVWRDAEMRWARTPCLRAA